MSSCCNIRCTIAHRIFLIIGKDTVTSDSDGITSRHSMIITLSTDSQSNITACNKIITDLTKSAVFTKQIHKSGLITG